MRITAALTWFDEPSALLERCVLSLAGRADALVAVDGRWEGFPAAQNLSPLHQAVAIERAAACAEIELHIPKPRAAAGAFASQAEKRTELMRIAADTGTDWILVIDADEHVTSFDRDLVDELLAATGLDVADVQLRNNGPDVRNHAPRPARRLLRASARPSVGPAHNYVRSWDGRWLAGDPAHVAVEAAADLTDVVAIVNEVGARPRTRQRSSELYYKTRREPQPA